MAIPRSAWGIDVGNRALKAVKLVREGDQLRVDDFEVIEHETVLSNSGDNRESLIQAAISNFHIRHQSKGSACSIGVSGQSSFARFIKLPPVEPKKIPEIVRFEAIQQIPFPLDDVEWSYQLFHSPESPDVEVGIFAMRKELINQHIAHFTSVDLNVQVVQMNPLAVYNAMQFDGRIDGTTMIIDLGAENTDLIIADENSIWLRSIPIGGNNFTEALVKSFKLNFPKAEDLKRNAATSKYARQIFQAMRPVFADLVAEVQRSIGFYASVHRDSRIKRILALGGTFKLPGLQKYLHQNLQLEVQRLDTLGAGSPNDPKVAANFNDNILSVVSAYGLALQAMGEGKITSSLLPQHIRREKIWKEKTKWFATAAALFALGTGIGYGRHFYNTMQHEGASADRQANESTLSQANGFDGEWNTIQGAGGPERQRILNIRSLEDYRDLWANVLSSIHTAVPTLKGSVDEIKKTPRPERQQIQVESVLSKYYADLTPVLAATDLTPFAISPTGASIAPSSGFGGGFGGVTGEGGAIPNVTGGAEGVPPTAAPAEGGGAAAAGRGFVITIHGTTPYNKGQKFINAGDFIEQTLVTALAKLDKTQMAGNQFYVAKVRPVMTQRIRDDQAKAGALKASYDAAVRAHEAGSFTGLTNIGGGSFGGGEGAIGGVEGVVPPPGIGVINIAGAAGPNPQAAPAGEEFKDRLTGEDVRDDWEFTIVAVIGLDPPAKPAAGAGTPTAAVPAQ